MVVAPLAAELATLLILETDTSSESVVSSIGGDALIGSSGDALFISRDSPLASVGLSIEMGVELDAVFEAGVEVITGAITGVVAIKVVEDDKRVECAGSTRASRLSTGSSPVVVASLAAELATLLILETDTSSESVVSPIGGDTLIGSSGDALLISRDSPLAFVGLSIKVGAELDIVFEAGVEVIVNTGVITVVVAIKVVEDEVACPKLVAVDDMRVECAGSTRTSKLLTGSSPVVLDKPLPSSVLMSSVDEGVGVREKFISVFVAGSTTVLPVAAELVPLGVGEGPGVSDVNIDV
jgi:hypothetical protein